MNMVQIDCCKNIFIKTKKIGNLNNKWEMNKQRQEDNDKEQNNTRNEHDRNSKLVFFVSKYWVCNFSTFDTTCVNRKKQYKNQYPLASRSFNRVKQDTLLFPKNVHAQHYYASKGKMKVKNCR